ncbi:MAG: hypothetical protein IMZ60_00200 [Actinobacteria bacterium]|nr:hypothetical protein [Actinomycetota bacterium]
MEIQYVDINKLMLDSDNARFAELYSGSDKEDDLIEYLLYTEAAEEIAKNISSVKQYYPDEVLWVIPHKDKFLVKDGNRRCASVKALEKPTKWKLDLPRMHIKDLPVLVYTDQKKLEYRIQEQHTHSLFREWDRIAKALKAFEMHNSGSSEEVIREIDSDPSQLIKLASFYYSAVRIANEDLKKLLRRGRGSTGGKTIIFERLFRYSKQCGYKFKNKPSYEIEIFNTEKFTEYVTALVGYLKETPSITHENVDKEGKEFLKKRLKDYGFIPSASEKQEGVTSEFKKDDLQENIKEKRGSVKTRPILQRKQSAPKLKTLIDECYNLDPVNFSNAVVALSRVTFEAVLKYVIEQTSYENKKLSSYDYFCKAFFDKKGNSLQYTDFAKLRNKFIELIVNTGTKNSFKQFDLDGLHQVIHNYNVGAGPHDAREARNNLMPIIEFLLQDTEDFLNSIDVGKL